MRGFLAEFLAISVWLFATRRDQNPDMLEPRRERRERARELQFSIDLALNPVESEHLKLSALILELIHMNLAKPDDYEFSALNGKRQAIVDVARAIFKTEWERVKKLE